MCIRDSASTWCPIAYPAHLAPHTLAQYRTPYGHTLARYRTPYDHTLAQYRTPYCPTLAQYRIPMALR
eukprot:1896205-Rhodomonas_salina.2